MISASQMKYRKATKEQAEFFLKFLEDKKLNNASVVEINGVVYKRDRDNNVFILK